MTTDRLPEALQTGLNVLVVTDYLTKKGASLEAIHPNTQRIFTLVLNGNGQLCHRDGNNIRLLPQEGRELVLSTESERLLEIHRTAELEAQTPISRDEAELEQLRKSINTIIEGTTRPHSRRFELALRSNIDKKIVPLAQTAFKLDSVPSSRDSAVLGRAYFEAVRNSIDSYKAILDQQGVLAKRIVTLGNITPYGETKKQFEMRLTSTGRLKFDVLDTGQTFVKYRVWSDYAVPQSAQSAVNDEASDDEDIPF